jgi:hypothetical protein
MALRDDVVVGDDRLVHGFSRLFAIVRTCLWRKWDLLKLLARYGTVGGSFRYLGRPDMAFFPGFI